MPLIKETVAVPVGRGINTHTADRLVKPDYLLEAVNSRLSGGGSEKRFGHEAVKVREGTYPTSVLPFDLTKPVIRNFGEKTLPQAYPDPDVDEQPTLGKWTWGWGMEHDEATTDDEADYPRSLFPEAGVLFGGSTRDNEILTWDGFNLYSYVPGANGDTNQMVRFNAVMPLMRAKPVAKVASAQYYPDIADNGSRRTVVWLDSENSRIKYSVLDSTTEAVVLRDTEIPFVVTTGARVVALGEWFHILFLDSDLDALTMVSFHEASPGTTSTRSLGDCAYWDFWKHDENTLLVVRADPNYVAWISWFRETGQSHPDYTSNVALATDSGVQNVGVALDVRNYRVGLIYKPEDPSDIKVGIYDFDGAQIAGDFVFTALSPNEIIHATRLTIAPRYEQASDFSPCFDAYASCSDGDRWRTTTRPFSEAGQYGAQLTRYHLYAASHAFNVGHRTFLWAGYQSTLQSIWLLLDSQLLPVGRLDFALAATHAPHNNDITLATPNFICPEHQKDRLVYHMGLGYRVRVPTDDNQVGLFTEPSIKYVQLDFLPWLRSAQAGRCTYFAGAQLWQYDGAEVVEQGFHIAPEFTLSKSNGGSLTALGTYSYRVDLCYTNGQGEEVRSHSLLVQTELTGSQGTITLTIKNMPTRREGAYFLIYRNAMDAGSPTTTWNLLNSRDPASANYRANDNTTESVTFVDDGTIWTDTEIQSKEAYPGNNSSYLYPFSSPGCEIVCAGADRLWVAGGELPAGQVAPSRLFDPGETPAFNANINRQVDRGDRDITALGFVGGVVIMFRENSAYVLDGDGPDNYATGYWPPARLALADVGAVSQESLALVSAGLLFQSRAGIRLIGPGGAYDPAGAPVDPTAKADNLTIRAAVVVPQFSEVRWYGEEYVLVFNYLDGAWSTWTLGTMGAVYNKETNLAVAIDPLGHLMIETEGLYTDGGKNYQHRIRFPWLHAGNLGDFQRIRRFSAFGEWDGDPHRVRAEIYFDEREHWDEYWEWDVPDDSQNENEWGADNYGDGTWGDTDNETLEDSVWRWRRRPRRQKCSVFSIAISDLGSDTKGFRLTTLGLELGKKTGLDRIPAAGGTNSYRS